MKVRPICRICGQRLPKGAQFGAVHHDCWQSTVDMATSPDEQRQLQEMMDGGFVIK